MRYRGALLFGSPVTEIPGVGQSVTVFILRGSGKGQCLAGRVCRGYGKTGRGMIAADVNVLKVIKIGIGLEGSNNGIIVNAFVQGTGNAGNRTRILFDTVAGEGFSPGIERSEEYKSRRALPDSALVVFSLAAQFIHNLLKTLVKGIQPEFLVIDVNHVGKRIQIGGS